MTTDEMYNEFNLVYNNLASNQAPGLDKYEISVYLTKSQNVIQDALYNEFEHSEEARKKLSNLVVTKTLQPSTVATMEHLYSGSIMFAIPVDVKRIINEKVKMNSKAPMCLKDKYIDIQPCLHDEVDKIVKNPYRFNMMRGLRLDTSVDGNRYSELILKDKNIEYYQIRYLQMPEPIILETLTNESIDGNTNESIDLNSGNGYLIPELHRQVVEVAAKMAANDYKS